MAGLPPYMRDLTRLRGKLPALSQALTTLPSVFTPIALPEGSDALAQAVARAPLYGAGTLVWVDAGPRAEAAVVLEPEMPLAAARLALLAAANALGDALGVLGPAELPVQFAWPAGLLVNGAACGGLRLAAPPGLAPGETPPWLAVGFSVRLAFPGYHIPGATPGETSLAEEGFEEIDAASLTETWARHLMAGLDEWQARGTARLAERFLARLRDGAGEAGLRRGIHPATGALVLDRAEGRTIIPLPEAL
jgi:biotin-(acetyl-CoA carboxylase) ligase